VLLNWLCLIDVWLNCRGVGLTIVPCKYGICLTVLHADLWRVIELIWVSNKEHKPSDSHLQASCVMRGLEGCSPMPETGRLIVLSLDGHADSFNLLRSAGEDACPTDSTSVSTSGNIRQDGPVLLFNAVEIVSECSVLVRTRSGPGNDCLL
jgi:hypothetical protein